MGAWGHESFQNDDALDWVGDLEESEGTSAIEAALNDVTDEAEDYLEAPECCMAIAAAEVVAALRSKPSQALPEDVQTWLQGKPAPDQHLVDKAKKAIETILTESELKDLWQENTELFPKWKATTEDLKSRLTK